jgi:hypothetical protein
LSRRLNLAELTAYDHIPNELAARARVVRVPFLAPGTSGLTLGRWIFLRVDARRDGSSTLIAHELVHVRQWHELGVARFLARYLRAYAVNLAHLRNHKRAYRAIPFEIEAYDTAATWADGHRAASPPVV